MSQEDRRSAPRHQRGRFIPLQSEFDLQRGLFVLPTHKDDTARLIGSRCRECGDVAFPKRKLCPLCDSRERTEEVFIGEKGTLYAYTVLGPPESASDSSTLLGLVALPEGEELRVIAPIEGCDPDEAKTGMALELTVGRIDSDPHSGMDVIGYKYRPSGP